MSKLCAALALACALAAPAGASAAERGQPSLQRAESAARLAVAPHAVESALCIPRRAKRVLCMLRHPDAGGLHCRSAVLVRGRRVRVIQSHVCFRFEVLKP